MGEAFPERGCRDPQAAGIKFQFSLANSMDYLVIVGFLEPSL